jgi:hypothetical protein
VIKKCKLAMISASASWTITSSAVASTIVGNEIKAEQQTVTQFIIMNVVNLAKPKAAIMLEGFLTKKAQILIVQHLSRTEVAQQM